MGDIATTPLVELAERQHGVVTRAQLVALGGGGWRVLRFTDTQIARGPAAVATRRRQALASP